MIKNFRLRSYQVEALNVIHTDLQRSDNVLLQAIMGSGKTVIASRLINKYFFETDRSFLILAHKRELVEQFLDAFNKFTEIHMEEIGVCCSGLNRNDLSKRITIGTIQTFVNSVDIFGQCSLLIVDEAHKISIETDSQYDLVIDT